jgi:hypothetical protein
VGSYAAAAGCTSVSISTSGSTRYMVIITANIGRTAPNGQADTGWESFGVSGATSLGASDQNAVSFTGVTGSSSQASYSTIIASSSGAVTFTLMQKTTNSGGVTFSNRSLTVLPLN